MAKVSFGSGGGGGASTGVPIGGAVANTVLFSDASSNLGSVAGFNFLQTMNQSSGTSSVFEVARSITQSSTAAYNGIRVNITETSTGSGIKNLLSLQIGGANRARIDNTGSTFLSNTATSGFRVFNSADEATNTEFAGVRWDTNIAKFGADRTGSGTERESWFGSMFGGLGRTYIRCIPSGVVHMYLDVPGSSTAGQTGFWISNNAAYNASSGSQSFMYMNYSVSQSGTAGYDGLLLNVTETSTGSGTRNLFRLTVGGTNRFRVAHNAVIMSSSLALNGCSVFNTADEATNFERNQQYWAGNVFYVQNNSGGSGVVRELQLGNAANYFRIFGSGGAGAIQLVHAASSNTSYVAYDLVAGAFSASSGSQITYRIQPSISQTGTAGYTAMLINVTETTTGSGVKRLFNLQVGSAFRFAVRNDGQFEIRSANTSTTVGAAGGASALPATPLGYISAVTEAGTNIKIPYYNA